MYVFLDQGSTHKFCNNSLIQSLGITGQSKKICLQTLADLIKGYDGIPCELEVGGQMDVWRKLQLPIKC